MAKIKSPFLFRNGDYVYKFMYQLSFSWSINRASACASTAVNALISINYINSISLRDSLSRAFTCAYAAADTRIINYISHCKQPPFYIYLHDTLRL